MTIKRIKNEAGDYVFVNSETNEPVAVENADVLLTMTESELKAHFEKHADELLVKMAGDNSPLKKLLDSVDQTSVHKPTHGFKSLSDFARAVKSNDRERLKALTTTEPGEYIIPQEYSQNILSVGFSQVDILKRATPLPLRGNSIELPSLVDKDRSTGSYFGGVIIQWADEGGTADMSKIKFDKISLSLKKMLGFLPYTSEIAEDAPMALDVFFRDKLGQALGWALTDKVVTGTGAGTPLGVLNSPAKVTVAKESSQTEAIKVENLFKMFDAMPAPLRRNAVWLVAPGFIPYLQSLTVGNFPVFIAGNTLTSAPHDTLLGRPVYEIENMGTIGDEGDIAFVDFSQYLLATKAGKEEGTIDHSMHVYFDTDKQLFRIKYRVDGQLWWNSSLKLKNGALRSPVVTLATRN